MTHAARSVLIRGVAAAVIAALMALPTRDAYAQASQRGQPKTPFGAADLGKLHWMEGTWKATAPGENPHFERYKFVNDSTIEIAYYSDSTFSRETGTGRVYLSVGRIYHTFGPRRWGATAVDSSGAYFVPQVNANNTFAWSRQSANAWTETLRTGYSGRERVTVYQMQRVSPQQSD
jgi:hypothetical protein